MQLLPILGVLVAASVGLAGFGWYEQSQFSAETGVANSLSTQVASLTGASSSYSTEVATLSSTQASLQTQLVQAQANVTALTSARSSLQSQLTLLYANLTSLTSARDSLQGQLAKSNENVTSLTAQVATLNGQISTLNGQITSLTNQTTSLNGQIAAATTQLTSLTDQIAALKAQVSSLTAQTSSYQSMVSLAVTTTLVTSQAFNIAKPSAGNCLYLPLFPSGYTAKSGGYLLITGTTNSTASFAIVTFPAPLSITFAYYLGTTVSTPIPITPGNMVVHIYNCGTAPMSATLTVKEVS